MEVTFSELKQKDVINLVDGRHLGKVCDMTFTFSEGDVQGFTVTGGKGFRLSRQDIFIPLAAVVKIGKDAVLVNHGDREQEKPAPPKKQGKCPPAPCPPKLCPPPAPCPPRDRRSLDEYE